MRTRNRQAPAVSTVLVLTNEDDTTAGMVIDALVRRGAIVARVDTGDFPLGWTVTGRIDSAGVWQGCLAGPGVEVNLELVTAIYYRRPSRYRVAAGLSPADRRFAEAEAHHGVGGLLSCLPCRWVSHPARIADASAKPGQLRLAAACGLRVPQTLVSNSPEQVREFVTEIDGPVVYKPMSPGALRTSKAPRAVSATLSGPDHGRGVAGRGGGGGDGQPVVEVPEDVATGLRSYLKVTGLAFAAFDLVRTTVGEHYFLEANANGEWGWLTDVVDLPIAEALADLLLGVAPS